MLLSASSFATFNRAAYSFNIMKGNVSFTVTSPIPTAQSLLAPLMEVWRIVSLGLYLMLDVTHSCMKNVSTMVQILASVLLLERLLIQRDVKTFAEQCRLWVRISVLIGCLMPPT